MNKLQQWFGILFILAVCMAFLLNPFWLVIALMQGVFVVLYGD